MTTNSPGHGAPAAGRREPAEGGAGPFDLLIRGGTVVDGSGGEPYEADVGIVGGRIAAIGALGARPASTVLEAGGRLVTPGFVDIHTHFDGQASWDQRLLPTSHHGVTTAVMGNCGVGFAPVRPTDRACLVELMEGVEDIPGTALHEGIPWAWESFPEYLAFLGARAFDIDLAAQMPHGAMRVYVMGERALALEPATDADIAAMRALTADAVRAGALGFSTSRSLNHRSIKGDPIPSLKAQEAELTGIAMGLADAGAGVLQFITDFARRQGDELGMLERIVRASGRPMSISLAQGHQDPDFWREVLRRIHAANADGLRMSAQVPPRPIGVLFGLRTSRSPLHGSATFQALRERPVAEMLAAMREPGLRARILLEAAENPMRRIDLRPYDYARVYPLAGERDGLPDYEPGPERSVRALADRRGIDPLEACYDLLTDGDGEQLLLAPFANYAHGNLDHGAEMLMHPDVLLGLGDGGAHVAAICDASFTTTLLTHWGRDRTRDRLPLPHLVAMLSARNAHAVGLDDRGLLAVGYKADVNVIDLARLDVQRPALVHDLPAGGRRFLQRATGYEATIVSGRIVYRDGEPTGELPGRLVRGSRSA